jgi:hypothetical protein
MKQSTLLRSSQIAFLTVFCILLIACQAVLTTPPAVSLGMTETPTQPQETPIAAPTEMGSWPLSPDRRLMVAQSSDGAWWMWDASTRHPVYLLNDRAFRAPPMHHPKFSLDGHYLAAISMGHIFLWEIASRKRRILIPPMPMDRRSLRQLVFSPDSQLLATNGCEQQKNHMMCVSGFVNLWNTSDGTLDNTLAVGFRVEEMTFSADGTTLSVSGCSRTDGGMGSYCYEQSQATYDVHTATRLILTRIPQFK